MASVSLGQNRGTYQGNIPDALTVGTVAASGNDMVVSFDLTKSINKMDAIDFLQHCIRYLEDDRLATAFLLNI